MLHVRIPAESSTSPKVAAAWSGGGRVGLAVVSHGAESSETTLRATAVPETTSRETAAPETTSSKAAAPESTSPEAAPTARDTTPSEARGGGRCVVEDEGCGTGHLKLPWRETGSPNHHDDIVNLDQ